MSTPEFPEETEPVKVTLPAGTILWSQLGVPVVLKSETVVIAAKGNEKVLSGGTPAVCKMPEVVPIPQAPPGGWNSANSVKSFIASSGVKVTINEETETAEICLPAGFVVKGGYGIEVAVTTHKNNVPYFLEPEPSGAGPVRFGRRVDATENSCELARKYGHYQSGSMNDFMWGDPPPGAENPPSPDFQQTFGGQPVGVPNPFQYTPTHTTLWRQLPRASELLRQKLESFGVLWFLRPERLIPEPIKKPIEFYDPSKPAPAWVPDPERSNRYCFPFEIPASVRTEEEVVLAALPKMNTVISVRAKVLADRVKSSLSKWGDRHKRAEGNGVHQVEFALEKVAESSKNIVPGASRFVVMSPDRAKTFPQDFFKKYSCVTIESDSGGWSDDLVLVGVTGWRKYPERCGSDTLRVGLREEMSVEVRYGPEGLQGRIVEDYAVLEPNPEHAYVITW